jgi:hypothetical protein
VGTRMGRFAVGFLVSLACGSLSAGAALAVDPRLPVPEVNVPSAPAVPEVNLPSAPAVPTVPSVPSPSPVEVRPTPSPQLPSGPSVGGVPEVGFRAPAPTSRSGGSPVGGVVSGVAGTAFSAGSSPGANQGATDRVGRRQAARRRARERSFRREVRRHAPCFYALSNFDRRVLSLRAGLRGGRPHSRADVARKLEVSAQSVRGAERRGVKRLRKANDSDGCAFASARGTSGSEIAFRVLMGTPLGQALAFAAGGTASDDGGSSGDRSQVAGVESEGDSAGISLPGAGSTEAGEGGLDWTLIAALVAAAAMLTGAAVARSTRRRAAAIAAAAGEGQRDKWSKAEEELAPPPWTEPDDAASDPASGQDAGSRQSPGPAPREHARRLRSRKRG